MQRLDRLKEHGIVSAHISSAEPRALEACDADARRAGYDSGYDDRYHHGSCPEGGCDDGDRYEGYEDGYQAGYDAADLDARDESR